MIAVSVTNKIADMKRGANFSKGRRSVVRARMEHAVQERANGFPPLTRAQILKIRRRADDLKDRTRFLLVSEVAPCFALYYNVSEDTYGMNEPCHATLFKRRPSARAIKELLGGQVCLLPCRVNGRGELILSSPRHLSRSRPMRR